MIKKLFPNVTLEADFHPTGLSSLIQNARNRDILFVNVSDVSKVDKILQSNLDESFKGLIVATKETNVIKSYNHVIIDKEEFEAKKLELINHMYPARDVRYVGVTGTNGKTTTCWLISELCLLEKKNVLYIGTIGIFYNGKKVSDDFVTTTPTLMDLRRIMHEIEGDIDIVALEISSHALIQRRLLGLCLDDAAWTNFSQDHLDYHKTMEEYFEAKELIVSMLKDTGKLFINEDEVELLNKVTSSKKEIVKNVELNEGKETPLFFKSSFNIKNLSLAKKLIGLNSINNIEKITPPPGRFEVIIKESINFVVDYAHTPDALENILREIKSTYSDHKIITVVGCGGDRDKVKRPLMAKVSCSLSDYSIFTSDNPRSEDPQSIIKDMTRDLEGIFDVEVDREKAIKKSFVRANNLNGDVIVVVAGKGHEAYQEINGNRYHFSDVEVINSL